MEDHYGGTHATSCEFFAAVTPQFNHHVLGEIFAAFAASWDDDAIGTHADV